MNKDRRKKVIYGIAVIGVLLMSVLFYGIWQQKQQDGLLTAEEINVESGNNSQNAGTIMVHIVGAVNQPGVYTLPTGARLIDAVEAAGGLTPEADAESLNLASVAEDAQKITIRTVAETQEAVATSNTGTSSGGLININTADAQTLQNLPGIGEVLAQNIVDYRTEHGGFGTIEEVKEVNRIGDKLFEQIKDKITI